MELTTRDISLKSVEDNQTADQTFTTSLKMWSDACLGEKSVQTKGGKEFRNQETDFEVDNKTRNSIVEGTSLTSSCIKTKPALLSIKGMH